MRERLREGAPEAASGRERAGRGVAHTARASAPAPVARGAGATRARRMRELQRRAGNRALARRLAPAHASSSARVVRRLVVRGDGDRQHNVDLVNTVIGFRDFGVTPGQINAEEFPGGDAAQAVFGPELTATPAANGQTAVRVTSEPINLVNYRMELPAAPPWARQVNKRETIPYVELIAGAGYADRLTPLRESDTDPTAFRVAGAPNDAAFAGLVETHEDQHVADLWTTTENILEPWDANLRALHDSGAPITAADEATARAAVFEAAGGTPAEIGQQMVDDMRDRGTAFHQTPAGGPPTVDDVTGGTGPNRLTLTWKHPLG